MSSFGLDTNVLVYAINEDSQFYAKARKLLNRDGGMIAWQNLTEFYAIVTDKRRINKCLMPSRAILEIKNLLENSQARVVLPNLVTGKLWLELLSQAKVKAQKVHDLFLAATFLSNGVKTLVTENTGDFKGVEGVRVMGLKEVVGK